MIRRTVLVSLRAGDSPPVLRSAYFADVLEEMTGERREDGESAASLPDLLNVGLDT